MKKQQDIAKRTLALAKETLRVLHASQLINIAGGATLNSIPGSCLPISCKEN